MSWATDVRLAIRMVAWALAVPTLKRVVPLRALARLMWRSADSERSEDVARIARLSWLVSRLQFWRYPDNCLERSLVAYRFLAESGVEPRLVIGVSSADSAAGHAWVTVSGGPVLESGASLAGVVPLVEFGVHGRPISRAQGQDLSRLPQTIRGRSG